MFTKRIGAGPYIERVSTQRVDEIIFAKPEDIIKKGVVVASGQNNIKEGAVMGRITASGKYRMRTVAALQAAVAKDATKIILYTATSGNFYVPFKVGEVITIDAAGANEDKTITKINPVTGEVWFAEAIVQVGGIAKDKAVILKTVDGSETAVGVAARPLFHESWNPDKPLLNQTLPVDYQLDLILSGWLRLSKLKGVDAAVLTELPAASLSPAFDCLHVR